MPIARCACRQRATADIGQKNLPIVPRLHAALKLAPAECAHLLFR